MKSIGKKVKALLVAAAMALTMFGTIGSVSAADSTDPALIDKNVKGSITVTKYKSYNSNATTNVDGTGMSGQTAPDGQNYELLNNAVFELYHVMNAADVIAYYSGSNNTSYTVDDFISGGEKSDYSDLVVHKIGETSAKEVFRTGVTGTNGNATGVYEFKNLNVGMYVLVEKPGADQIVAPLAAPVLISIPMVNSATSGNNGNSSWMYDVSVYPKNKTAESKIELTKVATDGTSPVSDVKFKLEKQVAADTWEAVTSTSAVDDTAKNKTNTTAFDENGYLTTGADGKLTVNNLPSGLEGTTYRLVEVSAPDGYIMDETPIVFTVNTNNTVTLAAENQNNSIIASSSTGSTTGGFTQNLTVRNDNPSINKKVKKNGSNEWVDATQYNIGQTYDYKIEVLVPHNVAELSTFKVTDTPEAAITDDADSVVIKYGDSVSIAGAASKKDNGFEINFKSIDGDSLALIAGKTVSIEYKASLNKDAKIADTASASGNVNTATLTFDRSKGKTEIFTINDDAVVYTYSIDITKRQDSESGAGMNGVDFELYKKSDNSKIKMTSDGAGQYYYDNGNENAATILTTAEVGENKGKLILRGLEAGEYYLKEIKTLDGYNLLSGTIDITISDNGETAWSTSSDYNDSKVLEQQRFASSTHTDNYHPEKTVVNKKGFVLPQTGTFGYMIVFAIGFILIIGGVILMLSGRQKKIR